jgi:hypothetical protein
MMFSPDVEGNVRRGAVRPGRWSAAPSSSGIGRSGVVDSGRSRLSPSSEHRATLFEVVELPQFVGWHLEPLSEIVNPIVVPLG